MLGSLIISRTLAVVIVALSCCAHGFSLIDLTADTASSGGLDNDWDSNFYGKPVCVAIPSNMSLCRHINYNQMKVPNLIGHDSVEEVVYQSSVWMPLLQVKCHRDTQLFLCSLFAPVCVEQQPSTFIYPCRSLCESVKSSCEGPMLAYNYPWPAMFNCSRFPEDNGLCIQASNMMKVEQYDTATTRVVPTTTTTAATTTKTTTTATTTTASTTTTTTPEIKIQTKANANAFRPEMTSKNRLYESLFIDNTCFACDEDSANMEEIVYGYCNSDIVLRARIQSIKISRLDTKRPLRRFKNMAMNRRLHANKTRSLLIKIDRRDRKFLKGMRVIDQIGWNAFLNEHPVATSADDSDDNEDEDEESEHDEDNDYTMIRKTNANKELSIYLMSSLHLAEANLNNDQLVRKAIHSRDPNLIARSRAARNMTASPLFAAASKRQRDAFRKRYTDSRRSSSASNHCFCEKLRKGSRRINTKYLIMANVLKSRNLYLNNNSNRYNSYRRNKRDDGERPAQSGLSGRQRLVNSYDGAAPSSFIDMQSNATIKIVRSKSGEHEIIKTSQASPLPRRRQPGQSQRRMSNKKYRELDNNNNGGNGGGRGKQLDLIYMTNFVQWHKARAFIDYLDNDSISKQDMCRNIKRTVKRINRAFKTLL